MIHKNCETRGVELCAHFDHPDVSNGPTENLNLKIKNTKRTARESEHALPGSLRRAS
jgi:hypothetical protein